MPAEHSVWQRTERGGTLWLFERIGHFGPFWNGGLQKDICQCPEIKISCLKVRCWLDVRVTQDPSGSLQEEWWSLMIGLPSQTLFHRWLSIVFVIVHSAILTAHHLIVYQINFIISIVSLDFSVFLNLFLRHSEYLFYPWYPSDS